MLRPTPAVPDLKATLDGSFVVFLKAGRYLTVYLVSFLSFQVSKQLVKVIVALYRRVFCNPFRFQHGSNRKDNFVDKGMCADFAIHDKGTGNPHVHIMLTLRPLKENGQWGAKCRKAYDLDENGQRIPDGKGGWKNHREDTTDWNDKGNVEIWRAAWAAYTNRALESAGRPERIDHRSYKRQGIDKIPSVHLGPAASQMEKRGIRTDKGR